MAKRYYRGSNSKGRKAYRKYCERNGLEVPPGYAAAVKTPVAPFAIGESVKLITDKYGRSYKGRTVLVEAIDGSNVDIKLPKRVSPLTVSILDLQSLKAA